MLAVPGPGTRFAPAWPCSAWGGGAPAGGLGAQSGLESLAGSRGKEVPRLAEVGAPGLRPRGRVGASKNGDWQSEVSVPVPRARACPSPAAYNGVPSLGGLRGDGSVGISPLSGVSGHPCRPPPRWRQGSAWLREPRELSAAVRARPDALAMCWPWPGSLGPLPMVSCVGTTGPTTRQGAARSPGPGCSGGKVSGVWVCPSEMAEK